MAYSRTDYEAVYIVQKGRPVLVLPVVGFSADGKAVVCAESGELKEAAYYGIWEEREDGPDRQVAYFGHVRPVGNTS